jgi:hypothetical protein
MIEPNLTDLRRAGAPMGAKAAAEPATASTTVERANIVGMWAALRVCLCFNILKNLKEKFFGSWDLLRECSQQ